MKNTVLSLCAVVAMSSSGFAGGEVAPVPVPVEEVVSAFFVGIAYTHLSNDADHSGRTTASEMDFSAFSLQAGYKFNPYVSIEGRYGMSFGDASDDSLAKDADITVWGIYVKPMYPISPEFDIYALLGYAGTNADDKNHVFEIDEGDFSWGLGAQYAITEDIALYADYLSFYDGSSTLYDYVVDSLNFGVAYRF